MERVPANAVKSLMFFISTQTVRSRLHFFPNGGATGGHHPVSCQLTLFGKGIESRSVRLDGGRLNQPDGVRLEDAFPTLNTESSGLCGLEVALSCPQGRVNLLSSRVVIEMVSPQFTLTYGAAPFRIDPRGFEEEAPVAIAPVSRESIGLGIHSATCAPSMIVVNSGEESFRPDFHTSPVSGDAPLQVGMVAPRSAVEFPLDDALCGRGDVRECLWGDAVIEKTWSPQVASIDTVECYMLYRDPASKRPLSVCAI